MNSRQRQSTHMSQEGRGECLHFPVASHGFLWGGEVQYVYAEALMHYAALFKIHNAYTVTLFKFILEHVIYFSGARTTTINWTDVKGKCFRGKKKCSHISRWIFGCVSYLCEWSARVELIIRSQGKHFGLGLDKLCQVRLRKVRFGKVNLRTLG